MSITTTRNDDAEIENYDEVMNHLGRITSLLPDGDNRRAFVDNPRLDSNNPNYLRVKVPRKGTSNMKVIEAAREMGLVVGDVWQMDRDRDEDVVWMKFVKEGCL